MRRTFWIQFLSAFVPLLEHLELRIMLAEVQVEGSMKSIKVEELVYNPDIFNGRSMIGGIVMDLLIQYASF